MTGKLTLSAACSAAAACLTLAVAPLPAAKALPGDTHVTSNGTTETIDCNDSTLFVLGSNNVINAMGSCYAVTIQGSSNTVIAENVVNDITVYGFNETVVYKSGDPYVWDRGRELGMTNHIDRVPA